MFVIHAKHIDCSRMLIHPGDYFLFDWNRKIPDLQPAKHLPNRLVFQDSVYFTLPVFVGKLFCTQDIPHGIV